MFGSGASGLRAFAVRIALAEDEVGSRGVRVRDAVEEQDPMVAGVSDHDPAAVYVNCTGSVQPTLGRLCLRQDEPALGRRSDHARR